MKVYVFSLRRIRKKARVLLISVSLILLIAALIGAFEGLFRGSKYNEASIESKPTVIIDAGHGGIDPGAIGVNGIYEKDINLAIVLLIGEELSKNNINVVYTRTDDRLLISPEEDIKGIRKISDLKNRCKVTNEYDSPILVSIHMNSYGASKYSGLQVYYKDEDEGSRLLADKIQSSVRSSLQNSNNRMIKSGRNLFLLNNCNGTGVIVECGFLTNPEECEKLSEKEYQKQLSFSIACAIIEYVNDNKAA